MEIKFYVDSKTFEEILEIKKESDQKKELKEE
jgi:hypothetical protein